MASEIMRGSICGVTRCAGLSPLWCHTTGGLEGRPRQTPSLQLTEGMEQTGLPDSDRGLALALGLSIKEQVVRVLPGSDRPSLLRPT